MEKSETNDRDHEKYINLSIQWNRWVLKPIGIWPNSVTTSVQIKYCYRLLNAFCYGLISFLFIPCVLYVVLEVKDVYDRLKLVGPLNFCIMGFMKYSALMRHRNDIRECMERIEWDWKNIRNIRDRDIMIANANQGRRLVTLCIFVMYTGFAFYYVTLPLFGKYRMALENENLTFIQLGYPFSSLIVDTRYSPVNEIVFSFQVLAGALLHGITAGACTLTAAFAIHACGQIKVLSFWLEHLIDGRADMCDDVDVRIGTIVSQHVRILKFLEHTERALQHASLVEVLGCMFNMCLLGYYIIVEWDQKNVTNVLTYAVLLSSFIFNIFIYCYIGELVDEQCRMVGEVTYMIDWHRLSGKRKLCFVLIIAMSNSSMKLTAGNIIMLSLSTFSDVIKTSFAFMNMLRKVA